MIEKSTKTVTRTVEEKIVGKKIYCDSCPNESEQFEPPEEGALFHTAPKGWAGVHVYGDEKSDGSLGFSYHLCPDCVNKYILKDER